MQTITISKTLELHKVEDYLKSLTLDPNEEYQIVIEDEELASRYANAVTDYLNHLKTDKLPFIFNEYNDALYFGTKTNPYHSLFKVKKGVTKLTLHPDCKNVCLEAAYYHDTLAEVYIDISEINLSVCSFAYASKLEKVTFVNSKTLVTISYKAFYDCRNLKEINLEMDGNYSFGERCFEDGAYIINLPRHCELSYWPLSQRTKLIFVPKEITSISNTGVGKDVEVYYEGELSQLEIKAETYERYETQEDYGWNFHRSSGSFTYHEVKVPAVYGKNGKSFATFEDFLKRKAELLNK